MEDASDKCVTETPAAVVSSSSSGAAVAVEDPSSRVMSMLYIQQGKLHANQSNNNGASQPLVHVVNKSQIAAFNQVSAPPVGRLLRARAPPRPGGESVLVRAARLRGRARVPCAPRRAEPLAAVYNAGYYKKSTHT